MGAGELFQLPYASVNWVRFQGFDSQSVTGQFVGQIPLAV